MKIRHSLVSNSSSASFICYWRDLKYDEDSFITDSVKKIFDGWGDDKTEKIIEELSANTKETNSMGTFKTEYFTSMYNDLTDIPSELAYFVTGLKAKSKDGFELIDFTIDRD